MKKIITITFILISVYSFGQTIQYKDCKNNFSTKHYRKNIKDPKYMPILAGICNYIVPTTGYYYVGEPLRGICVLGAETIGLCAGVYGFLANFGIPNNQENSITGEEIIMYSGFYSVALIQLWSIYDVVKIAKIKNLAYQEKNVSMKFEPKIFNIQANKYSSVGYGLQLNISF